MPSPGTLDLSDVCLLVPRFAGQGLLGHSCLANLTWADVQCIREGFPQPEGEPA